ncbi:MAG: bifunctional 2-polyprenyl-6-hydroxyphenol methylase/3-demethylubiquinol 3-O-methyltransferase UbiG [Aestuariibacter sp.]
MTAFFVPELYSSIVRTKFFTSSIEPMLDKSQLSHLDAQTNVDHDEIARFDKLAHSWWDPNGQYKNVLAFNQHRWQAILQQVQQHFAITGAPDLSGLKVLDVGCGGGLLCEPFAKQGAAVMGVDASEMSIKVARRHAELQNLSIDYRHCLAEQLLDDPTRFDIVLNTEVIEHVPQQQALIAQCCNLLKPGGLLVLATLNRTFKAYIVAIVGAEYVLRMLPVGTHDWRYFVKPAELQDWLTESQHRVIQRIGMAYNPLSKKWRNSTDLSVNYLLFATRYD